MAHRFNPPPGWPAPEPGWTPPEGWTPDPSWPAAPEGWEFWLPEEPVAPTPAAGYAAPPAAPPAAAVAQAPPPAPQAPFAPVQTTTGPRNGLGIAALVLGILGCLFGITMILFFIAGPLGVIGLILGLVGLSRVRKGAATNKGVTIAGVVLSIGSVLLSIIGFVVVVAVVDEAADDISNAIEELGEGEPGVSESCAGLTYPGQLDRDVCADGSGAVVFEGVRVTGTPLTSTPNDLGGTEICTTVTYQNESGESKSYNALDFELQTPSGDATTMGFSIKGDLGSGSLAPGAGKTGSVCTDDTGETGQHVLIYKPGLIFGARGIIPLNR